jgi:hypothetical protein
MTPIAGGFEATIPANDNQVIVYKFVVDGTSWIADPGNARKSPDGYGAFNSVMRVDCDHCPARAAIDWRDAVMYFVMVDRFYDGSVERHGGCPEPASIKAVTCGLSRNRSRLLLRPRRQHRLDHFADR